MSHEITRLYASAETAHAAVEELHEEGFREIYTVNPPAAEGVPLSAIAAQIAEGNVLLADARIYAAGVAAGKSLVTVHADFGKGKLATNILEAHGPAASGMPEPEPVKLWDEAAPLSSALMIPVLLNDPDPVSKVMGIPPLVSDDWSLSGALGLRLLNNQEMPEGRWGFKFLSNNPTPLSSLLGLPVLIKTYRGDR
ncbi:hypothetical protein [Aestuariivirga sp.]|uniref:hypothetical protein n=1 Tax=Aestuariivirga sp. TaxID=2650926 RepID=UPI003BABFD43